MKYYVILEDKNPKKAADYTVADFKALTANPVEDGPKNIILTLIKDEAKAIESAKAQSTENSAVVVFAVQANGRKVKGEKINAHLTTFESAAHVEPKKIVEPKKSSQFAQVLKSGLKLALLVSVGAAALTFAGILPATSFAVQFALGAAITTGTLVAAKVAIVGAKSAVRAGSAISNAVKKYFSRDKSHTYGLPKPHFTEEELKEQTDKLLESLSEELKTNPELVAHAIINRAKGLFIASENGFVIPPYASYTPNADTQEENKEENTKSVTKKVA